MVERQRGQRAALVTLLVTVGGRCHCPSLPRRRALWDGIARCRIG